MRTALLAMAGWAAASAAAAQSPTQVPSLGGGLTAPVQSPTVSVPTRPALGLPLTTATSDVTRALLGRWSGSVKQSEPDGELRLTYEFGSGGQFRAQAVHTGWKELAPVQTTGRYALKAGEKADAILLTTQVADPDPEDKDALVETTAQLTIEGDRLRFEDGSVLQRQK